MCCLHAIYKVVLGSELISTTKKNLFSFIDDTMIINTVIPKYTVITGGVTTGRLVCLVCSFNVMSHVTSQSELIITNLSNGSLLNFSVTVCDSIIITVQIWI